ncbi:Putative phage protein [Candidatus Fokinia solitaria]|uniref:Phage protein n=1 Tax=Candidatus Fokinia solitaria TaxID=1802984 RepID=A0A2U8BR56_9RICK|nr:phage head-tail connector protein [Candidatus Fokinia solitaria]AWD32821.1 Putative phage protein [Candidatus Fokinia solitaria]
MTISHSLPLSIEEIKLFLRIEHDEDNELLNALQFSSTKKLEAYLNIAIIPQTCRHKLTIVQDSVILPVVPIIEVQKITIHNGGVIKEIAKPDVKITDEEVIEGLQKLSCDYMMIYYTAGNYFASKHTYHMKYCLLEIIECEYNNRNKRPNSILDNALHRYSVFKRYKI